MSVQIDTALVNAYRSNIELQFQQMGSRLRPCVRVESQNAEYEYYDRIGPTTAVEITSRHSDTVLVDTPHSRRRVGLRDFDWADLVDRPDKLRMLADPTSSYAVNAAMALGRKMDDVIVEATIGTAYAGKTGGTSVTTGWLTVASSVGGSSSNLNTSKLREARQKLEAQEAIEPGEDIFLVCKATNLYPMLAEDKLSSADYNTIRALVQGEIDTFMGFKFIRTERAAANTCYAWARNALCLAVADEIKVDIGPRRDKRNSAQVYVSASFGATRMWEEKLVVITVVDSATYNGA